MPPTLQTITLGAKMDQRPIVRHNTYCHHEAGHAVMSWYHGIEIEYVRMTPSYPGHSGETKTVDHEVESLAQIEVDMQCAAAGKIAERLLRRFPEELSDNELIKCFTRYAKQVDENPRQDPDLPPSDGLRFAIRGRERDAKILEATADAATGPESWLPIFRETQRLIEDELEPAVKAVAYELTRNPNDLHNEDVAALATAALDHAEP